MSDHNHLHWLIRLPIVLLRSLTLVGAVVCLAGMGILTMMPIRLVIGMSEQVGDLLGPVVWCVGAMLAGVVFCRMAGTTLSDLLSRYVFGELVPAASVNPGEPRLLFLALGLGIICPWLGFELVVMLAMVVTHWSLPELAMNSARLLVVIGGGVDTVMLILRRYPRVFVDDPIVRRLAGRTKRK